MDNFIGLRLDGRYEITDLLGVGGMADVYRGRDIMENRVVAVKILKKEYSENEEFVRRFRNESKAIAVLSHPNIIKIYDVGYENSMQYIVMEYVDGITLKEYIEQQGMLKWRDCVHFTIQILRALQLAHDRGIVHRDIKPQNVMLLTDGTIKVMDFGIARFSREVENFSSEKTMGSVHYVSPEQASGERTDERSDIYSVGVMMYEMLTGRKPFNGDTAVAVALKHIHDQPVPPSEYVSSIYPGLEEIILHAMEKEPSKRYQSASEMIRDIEAFKQDQSVTFGYLDSKKVEQNHEEKSIVKEKLAAAISAIKDKPKTEKPKKERVKEPAPVSEEVYYEEYDDDDEVEIRHNYALPILAAVTVTAIIVATLFVANVILGAFKTTASSSNDYEMPNLIGMSFYDARAKYTDIQLVATEEYNNEYPAGEIIQQEKGAGRIVKIGDSIKVTVSKGVRMVTIPGLKNYHLSSAVVALEQQNLNYIPVQMASDEISADFIIGTDPAEGTEVEEGTTVRLFVSLGSTTEDTTVPYVVGENVVTAKNALQDAYLDVKIQYSTSIEERDTVISQNIEGGTQVPRDTIVTIFVSDGSGEEEEFSDETFIPDNYDPSLPYDPNDPNSFYIPPDNPNAPDNVTSPNYQAPQGEVMGTKSVTILVDIPSTAQSTYYMTVCRSGSDSEFVCDQHTVDSSVWAGQSYPITIEGEGTMTVDVYIRTKLLRMRCAVYTINFDEGTYNCEDYSASAFRSVDSFALW